MGARTYCHPDQGWSIPTSPDGHTTQAAHRMQRTYSSTAECILQNLSMTVGNPSARCYANAPWRAFTWTCALLQETHTQPWGNLQEAVQESMELAEAVDLHQLPALQPLWTKHDLNIQGDANHFVNSLWNLSQTRDLHYRFAEPRAEEPPCMRLSSHWFHRRQEAHGKKAKTACWEQLQARLRLALKQSPEQPGGPCKGFMTAIQDAPKHWLGPPTWGQFLDTCHHWHRYRNPPCRRFTPSHNRAPTGSQ